MARRHHCCWLVAVGAISDASLLHAHRAVHGIPPPDPNPHQTSRPLHRPQDLMQFPDRLKWYEVKLAADDM